MIDYIGNVLMEPDTALRWSARLKSELAKLSFMPGRIALTEEEPWRSRGIHRMIVQNFLIYFPIDDRNEDVWIIAVVYNRRDRIAALIHSGWLDQRQADEEDLE
jgi:toxin ParE1/3/4